MKPSERMSGPAEWELTKEILFGQMTAHFRFNNPTILVAKCELRNWERGAKEEKEGSERKEEEEEKEKADFVRNLNCGWVVIGQIWKLDNERDFCDSLANSKGNSKAWLFGEDDWTKEEEGFPSRNFPFPLPLPPPLTWLRLEIWIIVFEADFAESSRVESRWNETKAYSYCILKANLHNSYRPSFWHQAKVEKAQKGRGEFSKTQRLKFEILDSDSSLGTEVKDLGLSGHDSAKAIVLFAWEVIDLPLIGLK